MAFNDLKCFRCGSWPCTCADKCAVLWGNCRELLPLVYQNVGLVVTDPPYGIGADKAKAHSRIRDNAKWPAKQWDTKPDKSVFDLILSMQCKTAIWGGNYFSDFLPGSRGWLCWRKPEAETGFSMADFELCWTNFDCACRMKTFSRITNGTRQHPTQKPVELMIWCISLSRTGGNICDPFSGSGTTLIASKRVGRRSLGIETDKQYCEIAAKRLDAEPMPLFAEAA